MGWIQFPHSNGAYGFMIELGICIYNRKAHEELTIFREFSFSKRDEKGY
jgi:hypothetical protein